MDIDVKGGNKKRYFCGKQTKIKRSFKGEQSLGNTFLWGERNLHCISHDVVMLGRKGKALKCQGVQKPGSLFSKAL